MDLEQLERLLAGGETLEVEFKSDRGSLSDSSVYEQVVALANSKGGVLLIGVEDNGKVTGAKPRHGSITNPHQLQSAIFNNTVPSINTNVSLVQHPAGQVISIEVQPYPVPCATKSGKVLKRSIKADGKPESIPFYPIDHQSRSIALGLTDFSAQVMDGASFSDLDPLEFARIRQAITRLPGDQALLELSDQELAKALRLVETKGTKLTPNVAGLLLLGRREALERHLPTHEVFFQSIDSHSNVKTKDYFREPLVKVIEEIGSRFAARNQEREVQVGMYRLPVPDYSPQGFREAVNNSLQHRDYAKNQAVYIQWLPDHLLITNPGGFPEGITPNNILTHEPTPRNPRLTEVFRRIGLVEQTGRGVDRIFEGQLRYGRPVPDYSRSDNTGVRVVLHGGEPSLQFAALVVELEAEGKPLSLDELVLLNALHLERRIDAAKAGVMIQKGAGEARAVLERLHERGMVEARGEKSGRVYHLSAKLYERLGGVAAYVRTRGFDHIQQRQMILEAVKAHGRITRKMAAELCQISDPQAYRLLTKMAKNNVLHLQGSGRGAYYVLNRTE